MSNDNAANDPMNFVKNMWGNMGFSLPGMVTPTFDVEEIEKKVTDLKAVEGWLKMNLSMLQMTIQSLEMQCATLNAVRTMGKLAASQTAPAAEPGAAPAGTPPTDDAGREAFAQATMWPWNLMQQMQDQMQQAQEAQQAAAAQQAAQSASEEPPKTAPKKGKKA